jgi:O-antigen/teichoic acid export membrane protein
MLGRFGQMVLALVTMRFATTFLSPDEMGRMMLILTVISFFSLFLVSPVGMFITRRLHAWNESGRLMVYFRYHLGFLFVVSLLSAFAVWFLGSFSLITINVNQGWLIGIVCSSLVLTTTNQTTISALNILGQRNWFVWLTLLTGVAGLLASVLLTINISKEASVWIFGVILGQTLGGIIGWVALSRKFDVSGTKETRPTYEELRRLAPAVASFVWPLTLTLVLAWTQNQWYRFFFEEKLGIYSLGLFVAGLGISVGIIGALESILTAYLLPSMYKRINMAEDGGWLKAWTEYAAIVYSTLLMFVVYIFCLAPELTRILVGSMYQPAAQYVAWGALIELFRVSGGVIGLVAHATMKTRLLLWPAILGAATSIVLVTMLLPSQGATGVAMALALAGLVVSVSSAFFMLERVSIQLSLADVAKMVSMGTAIWLATIVLRNIQFSNNPMVSAIATAVGSGLILLAVLYFALNKKIRGFAA